MVGPDIQQGLARKLTDADLIIGRVFYTKSPKADSREVVVYQGLAPKRGRLRLYDPCEDIEFTARRGDFLRLRIGTSRIVGAEDIKPDPDLVPLKDKLIADPDPQKLFVIPKIGGEATPVIADPQAEEVLLRDYNDPKKVIARTNPDALLTGEDESYQIIRVQDKFDLIFNPLESEPILKPLNPSHIGESSLDLSPKDSLVEELVEVGEIKLVPKVLYVLSLGFETAIRGVYMGVRKGAEGIFAKFILIPDEKPGEPRKPSKDIQIPIQELRGGKNTSVEIKHFESALT